MMRSRRELFRFSGGALFAGFSNLPSRWGTAGRRRDPVMAIIAPRNVRVGRLLSVGVRIELLQPEERVETIDLTLPGRLFPGVARFLCTDRFPIVTVRCQIRLERSETLVAVARLADGRTCTSSCPITILDDAVLGI